MKNFSGILYDFHLHSHFSSDSDANPEDEIRHGINIGLSGMCFTEHNDFGYISKDGSERFQLDFKNYLYEIKKLQKKYLSEIEIFIGLEQGLTLPEADLIEKYDPDAELDFIIGSAHVVEGMDPYYSEYWEKYGLKNGILKYFESIYETVKNIDAFDVYGHLDYIVRYIPDEKIKKDPLGFFPKDLIYEILKLLISKGKGIEINTAGWRKGTECNPNPFILKNYYDLGGELITVGSDAHCFEDIGADFKRASLVLSEAGFNYYSYFKKRKPLFLRLCD